ncbi:MAG TPA: hypothetical protein ENG48_11280 [Candidatus Atribacteria bacterium]|nr:hypothetical protein [Candidatus Atribacteria bacterium]
MKKELYNGAKVVDVDITEAFKNPEKYKEAFKSQAYAYLKRTTLNGVEAIRVIIYPIADHWATKQFNDVYPAPKPVVKSVYRHKRTNNTPEEDGLNYLQARKSGDYVLVQEYQTADPDYLEAENKRNFKLQMLTYLIVFNLLEDNYKGVEPLYKLKDVTDKKEWEKVFDDVERRMQLLGISINQLKDLFAQVNELDSFRTDGDEGLD